MPALPDWQRGHFYWQSGYRQLLLASVLKICEFRNGQNSAKTAVGSDEADY